MKREKEKKMREKENNSFLDFNNMKFNYVVIVEAVIIIIQGCDIIKIIRKSLQDYLLKLLKLITIHPYHLICHVLRLILNSYFNINLLINSKDLNNLSEYFYISFS